MSLLLTHCPSCWKWHASCLRMRIRSRRDAETIVSEMLERPARDLFDGGARTRIEWHIGSLVLGAIVVALSGGHTQVRYFAGDRRVSRGAIVAALIDCEYIRPFGSVGAWRGAESNPEASRNPGHKRSV